MLVDTDDDGQANVLLVDTTDDGSADTLVHIYGTDSWQRAPSGQHTCCEAGRGGGGAAAATSRPTPPSGAGGGGRGKGGGAKSAEGKHGWTREEDETIVAMVLAQGQKWSRIATSLPGRTDDSVRNRYAAYHSMQPPTPDPIPPRPSCATSVAPRPARYLRLQRKKAEAHMDDTEVVTSQDLETCEPVKRGDMWTPEVPAPPPPPAPAPKPPPARPPPPPPPPRPPPPTPP